MAAFVVPRNGLRIPMPLLGLFQVLAALGLCFLVPRRPKGSVAVPSWTHRAAVILLATWPLAWAGIILLSID